MLVVSSVQDVVAWAHAGRDWTSPKQCHYITVFCWRLEECDGARSDAVSLSKCE